jgi:hypothetical protein
MSVRGLGGAVELIEGSRIRPLTTVPGLYLSPKFLTDRRVLYFSRDQRGTGALEVGALDGSQPVRTRGVPNTQAAAFTQDYLVYATPAGVLNGIRFDLKDLAASGQPVLIADRVGREDRVYGVAAFSVSASGSVAYRETAVLNKQMMWMDRDGSLLGTIGAPASASPANVRLSPDGKTALFFRQAVIPIGTIWMIDTQSGVQRQFPENVTSALWSPNGDRVLHNSNLAAQAGGVQVVLVDRPFGSGGTRRQVSPAYSSVAAEDWAPNGAILYRTANVGGANGYDLFAIPAGQTEPVPVARTSAEERGARFSPDARWIAYQSNEGGRYEVYVQPFPGTTAERQRVSLSGGVQPQWGRKGGELYFLAGDNRLMTVSVESTINADKPAIAFGLPKPLFKSPLPPGSEFTVANDGDRFLIVAAVGEYPSITVVSNWMPGK